MVPPRPKVLFFTAWYPTRERPAGGGFVREHALSAGLSADVAVVHWTGPEAGLEGSWRLLREDDPALHGGIPTWRLAHRDGPIKPWTFLRWVKSCFGAWEALEREGFIPDLIHAHVFTVALPVAILAGRKRRPWILTEHASNFPRRMLSSRDLWKVKRTFPRAARVLPVSRFLQQAIEDYGIQAHFEVLPNAVDTDLFHPPVQPRPPGPSRWLNVAMHVPVKGLDVLLAALATLKDPALDWELDLVGEGPEKRALENQAAVLGLQGRVRFPGLLPREEVARRMREADLFILPSLSENLPCVLLEAMASGLPVVASRAGGIPELINHEQGELVTPGDPEALAAALRRCLVRKETFDRQRLARRAQSFSRAAVGERLAAVYREVLKR